MAHEADLTGARVVIVQAPYYAEIIEEMVRGARLALKEAGVESEPLEVPGAFEIPAAIERASRSGRFDGFIALGCVIRGETTHYDYVCGESARGLMDLSLKGLAIGYGVLTVENQDQARARASVSGKDKGGEAARACLRMMMLARTFKASA